VVLVNKPGGSIRICIDYRKLNMISLSDGYPVPRISEVFEQIGKIIPCSDISLICRLTASRFATGIRYGFCDIGMSLVVRILCFTRVHFPGFVVHCLMDILSHV
jgi:hypothetical protein